MTISLRDICRLGSGALRDRRSALDIAETLTKAGWLASNGGDAPPLEKMASHRRHHPRGNACASEHAEHEYGEGDGGADRPS
jgi:hypothetical protein